MSSSNSSENYNELLDRINQIKTKQAKLEGARNQVIKELRELGYKTHDDATKWLEQSENALEKLNVRIQKEKQKVEAELDDYENSQA